MTLARSEFERQMGKLASVISRTLTYYAAWDSAWPTEETVKALNRFRDFFSPVRGALFEVLLIHVSKVWENDGTLISLPSLLDYAKQDMQGLVPHATIRELDDMCDQLSQQKLVLEYLTKMKDQHLAHIDSHPFDDATIRKGDVDNLVKTVQLVFNRVSVAHEGSSHAWSIQSTKSSWVTTEMLRILVEEISNRGQPPSDTST